MTVEEDRRKAKEKLKGICGVYKICDGDPSRLCQNQNYGKPLLIGGIGSGSTFHNNYLALKSLKLKMKLVSSDFVPDVNYTFFGNHLSMPIMGASVTGVNSFGGDQVITEKEFCRATVFGCNNAGTLAFRGDTYTYSLDYTPGLDAISEAGGIGVKIVKPREQSAIIEIFKKAESINAVAVGIDIDGCGSSMMALHEKPVFRKTEDDLKEIISATRLPVIIKGIMCEEDALMVADAGASAIVVSNHGGRVLDHTPGTAEVLPKIAESIKGRMPLFVDGGIRNGYDVLKMLALGADAVLIGRDIIRAAVGGGIDGVQRLMEYLQSTLMKAMKMTECQSLKEVSNEILL